MDTREFNKLYNDMRHPSNDEPMYNTGIISLPHGYQYGGGAIGYSQGGLAPITSRMPIAPGYADGGLSPTAGLAGMFKPVDSSSPPISDSLLPKGMTNEISNLIYYGPHDNSIANWKGLSPDNPSTGYVKVEPTSSTSNLPIDQTAALSSRDKLIKALTLAGFSSSDINTIVLKNGYADGGTIGYAHGGYISQGQPVNTHLTTTIPPVRGPMSQGVETLFKRRYS
jgi:hypothetical protein